MIYLDTCYIIKCYLTENGSAEVRRLTAAADGLASCTLAKVEFAAAVHRQMRESRLDAKQATQVLDSFESDCLNGYWCFFGLSESLLTSVNRLIRRLDRNIYIRTNDAIHLVCARENGFREIYSNDRHLLAASQSFAIKGVNIIG
jgi:predicted nucleic acid-binding protein